MTNALAIMLRKSSDCFSIKERRTSADGRLALPPPWVQAESALSFDSDRPHLAFVEEGVDLVAIYGQMDMDHAIMFRVVDNQMRFEKNVMNKLL
jgi:hypothetical protein